MKSGGQDDVAALVAEESLRASDQTGPAPRDYAFEYLGTLELAKNYGRQAVYLMARFPVSDVGIAGRG